MKKRAMKSCYTEKEQRKAIMQKQSNEKQSYKKEQ
jgi:hypothetical protein